MRGAAPNALTDGETRELARSWMVRYAVVIVALILVQTLFSEAGRLLADAILAPGSGRHAHMWVHHATQAILALALIAFLRRRTHLDFGFRFGSISLGLRAVGVCLGVTTAALVAYDAWIAPALTGQAGSLPFAEGPRLGELAFQLGGSGTSEEILFRSLAITVLAGIRSVRLVGTRWPLTLETLVAAVLFGAAHVQVSTAGVAADPGQLVFAFVMGLAQGVIFQRTRSIVWPMLLHSASTVVACLVVWYVAAS